LLTVIQQIALFVIPCVAAVSLFYIFCA
jgi:hypothetical protein